MKAKVAVCVCVTHLSEGAIKNVHWRVINSGLHVLHIVLHLHFDRVAIVVLATLELLVTVLTGQPLEEETKTK